MFSITSASSEPPLRLNIQIYLEAYAQLPILLSNTIPPLKRKGPLIYEMLLCQSVKVQVLQEAALQDATRCRAYLLSHSNISLAKVNELDTERPRPAPQTQLPCTHPSFSLRQVAKPDVSATPGTAGLAGRMQPERELSSGRAVTGTSQGCSARSRTQK